MTDEFLATTGPTEHDIGGMEPCPFCGGPYQEIWAAEKEIDLPGSRRRFAVRCDCGASMEGSCVVYPYENADAVVAEAARREWNRRAA